MARDGLQTEASYPYTATVRNFYWYSRPASLFSLFRTEHAN